MLFLCIEIRVVSLEQKSKMRIANVMISRVLGGVEQAFLDYASVLEQYGHDVLMITAKNALINQQISQEKQIKPLQVNFAFQGWGSFFFLYSTLKQFSPDVIITHSKKVIPVLRFIANLLNCKIIAVAHNDKYKRIDKADAIFSITEYQKDCFANQGYLAKNIFVVPNMIDLSNMSQIKTQKPITTFGIMGRFDPAKGFTDFIEALNILKQKGYSFKAIIGGKAQGDYIKEENKIKNLVDKYNLKNEVAFLGWVENKSDFYDNIDVFVLPSHYEPFGIVLLEAMKYGIPIISSLVAGPKEILSKGNNSALTYEAGDINALAEHMIYVLQHPKETSHIAEQGQNLVQQYSPKNVGPMLEKAINQVVK